MQPPRSVMAPVKIAVFVAVWLACPILAWALTFYADSRHDVEWAAGATLAVGLGLFSGPLLGFLVVRLMVRNRIARSSRLRK